MSARQMIRVRKLRCSKQLAKGNRVDWDACANECMRDCALQFVAGTGPVIVRQLRAEAETIRSVILEGIGVEACVPLLVTVTSNGECW